MDLTLAQSRPDAEGGLVDSAMRAINQHIRSERLRAGDPVPSEAGLAAELGVSRTVVREAFRSLAALGIIDLRNGRRARVGTIDKDVLALVIDHVVQTDQITIQQIYDVRRTIEMRTVALAALRRSDRGGGGDRRPRRRDAPSVFASRRSDGTRHRLPQAIAVASRNPMFALIVGSFSVVTRQTWRIGWDSRRPTPTARQRRLPRGDRRSDCARANRARPRRAMAEHFDNTVKALLAAGVDLRPADEDHRPRDDPARGVRQSSSGSGPHREGITGLGETFFFPATVEAYVHEAIAPKLLGRDPLAIDRIAKDLAGYLGFRSTGAEMRGNSALDIALWDLFGKVDRPADRAAPRRLLARQDPHLQHLRRHRLHAPRHRAEHRQLGARRGAADYDDLNGFLHARRRARRGPSRRGDHGDEDLAVRPRRREERRRRHLRPPISRRRSSRSRRSAARSATAWRSWSSSIRSGSSCRRCASPGARAVRHELARGSDQDGQPRRPQALRRGFAGADLRLGDARHRAGPSAISSRPAPRASSCSTSPGAAGCRRRARSRRWPRPGTCRSRRTTAPGRWCSRASTHLSLNAPNALDPGERARLLSDLVSRSGDRAAGGRGRLHHGAAGPGLGLELAPDIDKRFTATVRISKRR